MPVPAASAIVAHGPQKLQLENCTTPVLVGSIFTNTLRALAADELAVGDQQPGQLTILDDHRDLAPVRAHAQEVAVHRATGVLVENHVVALGKDRGQA